MNNSNLKSYIKPRLLLCLTSMDQKDGGVASVNRNILRALQGMKKQGANIDLFLLIFKGNPLPLDPRYFQGQVRPIIRRCFSSRLYFLLRFIWIFYSWRPTFVFVDHLHLAVVPFLLRWLLPIKYTLFCHGIEINKSLPPIRKAAFRAAHQRLSNSLYSANRIMEFFPECDVEACELGIDDISIPDPRESTQIHSFPNAFGIEQELGDQCILIVSRLDAGERYKGHEQLIQVMPTIIDKSPVAQLIIVGEGTDMQRIKSLAIDSGAGKSIIFTGYVGKNSLSFLFDRCKLYAMPSCGEGFGVSYLEAMKFGKPCVASRSDGGSDVVVDGLTGILVDPSKPAQIEQAISRILSDNSLANQLGQAGLARQGEKFSFESFAVRLQKHLSKIIPELSQNTLTSKTTITAS